MEGLIFYKWVVYQVDFELGAEIPFEKERPTKKVGWFYNVGETPTVHYLRSISCLNKWFSKSVIVSWKYAL